MSRSYSLPIQLKAAPQGMLAGYASTFGNVDLVGDVIAKGAWAETLAAHRAAGGADIVPVQRTGGQPRAPLSNAYHPCFGRGPGLRPPRRGRSS